MRRVISFAMVVALSAPASSVFAAPPARPLAQSVGSIAGKATTSNGRAMSNASVRVRSLADGRIIGTSTTNASGGFSFTSLPAGDYTIEVVNAAGDIVGTSSMISLGAGASVTGVTVMASAVVASAAGAGGSFLASTAGLIAVATAGAAVAAITVAATRATASPSQ